MLKWARFLLPTRTTEVQERIRSADLVKAISLAAFFLTLLVNLPSLAFLPSTLPSVITTLVLCWVYLVTYYLARRGRTLQASIFLSSLLWLIATAVTFVMGGLNMLGFIGYIIVIIVASLLLGNRAGIIFFGLSLLTGVAILLAETSGATFLDLMPRSRNFLWITQLGLFITTALLLQFAFRTLQEALDRAYQNERALERRAVQIQVAAEVARDATTVRQMDVLLNRAVDLIRERFGFYHAAIFLIDEENEYAVLRAATGEAGKKMLEAGHRLKIGEKGIVTYVASSGKPRIALDVGQDAVHLKNPLLPDTRSEMSVPLKTDEGMIGVLDVQSQQEAAFDEQDISILQTLADQLATAIETARLFDAARRQLMELTVLHKVANACAQVASEDQLIESATQIIGDAFFPDNFGIILVNFESGLLIKHPSYRGSFESELPNLSLGQGITGKVAQSGKPWRAGNVSQESAYVVVDPYTRSELCVPISTTDNVIGVINAESQNLNAFSEADERLLATLAGQLATGIQKARLIEETQHQVLENARLYGEAQQRTQELTDALTQLQELDILKNKFIQTASHELRTPLAIALGYAELFESGDLGELSPEQRELITIMSRRLRALSKLLEDMLTILESEAHAQPYKHVDLSQLAYASLAEFKLPLAQAGLELESEIALDLPLVSGIPDHLQRAFHNLLNNAIKFTPEGGKVSVRLWQQENHLTLEVSDTGIGIPPDHLERIFDRFYQVDGSTTRRYGGTGLGLALVKEVIEEHGGSVSVRSTPGGGSAFQIRLPVLATHMPGRV